MLPYSNLTQTSQSDMYIIHPDKHSQHIVDNFLHPDKSAMSKTPSTIPRIVKDPVDRFIDLLVEGKETIIKQSPQSSQLNLHFVLKEEIESRTLPPIDLTKFDGNPGKWPEFIYNFKTRVHNKATFTDSVRMARLISVLEGDVKKTICSIGIQSVFYATALKTLKRDFGNPVVVAHLKLTS